jgi:hypothetical protein
LKSNGDQSVKVSIAVCETAGTGALPVDRPIVTFKDRTDKFCDACLGCGGLCVVPEIVLEDGDLVCSRRLVRSKAGRGLGKTETEERYPHEAPAGLV